MSKNPHSLLLVLVQALSTIFLFLSGPVIVDSYVLFALELAAIGIGAWSVLILSHKSKIQITPEVAPGARLINEGPYSKIRHPMYSSLLLLTLVLVVNYFTWQRLTFWVILLIDLLVKVHYEENILEKFFNSYREYQKKTKKLIPFIY